MRSKGQRQGREAAQPSLSDRRRPPQLVLLAVALATLAGLFVAGYGWLPRRGLDEERPLDLVFAREEHFEGPAYSSGATVEDLKQEALRTADDLLALYPESAEALAVAGRLHFSLGSSERAATLWRRGLTISPDFAGGYFGLGLAAKDRGDFDEAAEMFQKVALLAPEDPRATPLLAEVFMESGRPAAVIEVVEQEMRIRAPSVDTAIHLGQAYLQLRDYEKAKQTFAAVFQADPTAAGACYGLSRVCARLGQKEESLEYMEKFRALHAVDEEAMAREVREYEDIPTARRVLVQTLVESGDVYRALGGDAKAEEMWRKAASLDASHAAPRRALVSLYEEQNRDQDALWITLQLCEVESDNSAHWLNAGLLYGRLQRYGAARAAIEKAIQLDPTNFRYREAYELVKQGH